MAHLRGRGPLWPLLLACFLVLAVLPALVLAKDYYSVLGVGRSASEGE